MGEKRKYIRINECLTLSYRILESIRETASFSKNISEGGICFLALQRFQPGVILELKIELAALTKPILVVGEVRWCVQRKDCRFPFEVGIKFIKTDSASLHQFQWYLRNLSTDNTDRNVHWLEKI